MTMNYDESLAWIHERTKFGIKPGIKRMEWMLAKLGNPEKILQVSISLGLTVKGLPYPI